MVEFRDFFNVKKELIDTSLAWDQNEGHSDGWCINLIHEEKIDLIRLNANEKLYNQFLEENFYKPLKDLIDIDQIWSCVQPSFNIEEDINGNKSLNISYLITIVQILDNWIKYAELDLTKMPVDLDAAIKYMKDVWKEERKAFLDVKNNGKQSKFYESVLFDYTETTGLKSDVELISYVDFMIDICNKFILGSRNIRDVFLKKLNIEKLCACVGYDKFCLLVACSFFENMRIIDDQINELDYCYVYIENYIKHIQKYREINKNYSCKIKVFYEGKIYNYSVDDLIDAYKEFMLKYPEADIAEVDITKVLSYFQNNNIDKETLDNMTNKELTNLITNIMFGMKVKDVSEEDYEKNINNYKKQIKETDDQDIKNKLQQQISKMEFLKNNEPVKIIKGYGSFDNYYGYVYSNGYVVLDVILDDVNKSYGHAIYIMPYNKLIEYSEEKKKTNIKSKIDVIPIPHRGNWEERLLEKMNSLEKLPLELDEPSIELKSIVNPETLRLLLEQLSNVSKNPSEEIKQRIAESVVIDEELKNSEPAPELTKSEEEQLGDIEFELLEESKGQDDFFKLHKLAKEKEIKVKRNPEVSLKTKLRTKDKDGFYHCDLCDSVEQKGNNNSIGKSIRMFESHHIVPISEGGIDNIYNTCCLCPNCHTRIHNYLKLKEKIKKGIPVDEGAMNEFMTMAEYGSFLKKVRERIALSTPEYLSKFDELFNPNYKNDKGLTDKELEELYKQEEEYYKNNKEQEDAKFLTDWNTPLKR